jgi:hypothetical protein
MCKPVSATVAIRIVISIGINRVVSGFASYAVGPMKEVI